jgi:hypothetical protein
MLAPKSSLCLIAASILTLFSASSAAPTNHSEHWQQQQLISLTPRQVSNPSTQGSFTVLTYNIAGLPAIISGGSPDKNTAEIGLRVRPFDFVNVQVKEQQQVLYQCLFTERLDHRINNNNNNNNNNVFKLPKSNDLINVFLPNDLIIEFINLSYNNLTLMYRSFTTPHISNNNIII